MLQDAHLNELLTLELALCPNFLETSHTQNQIYQALQKGAQPKSNWATWLPATAAATVAMATETALCILQRDTDTRE